MECHLFVHSLSLYEEHHTHLPISNPSLNKIGLFSDHVSFKTFSDHNRMVAPHVSMLFTFHGTSSLPLFHLMFMRRGGFIVSIL